MSQRRHQAVAGIALIAAGIAFWFLRDLERFGDAAVFLVIGITFIAIYFAKRRFGLLVPGCLLTGLGVGMLFGGGGPFEAPVLLGLGAGFVAVWVIAKLYQGRSHWWPLVPGAILLLLGIREGERVVELLVDHWPLVLVAVGVVVLAGALRPGRR